MLSVRYAALAVLKEPLLAVAVMASVLAAVLLLT